MERKKNRESGVVTIEATISLTAFMFAIVTILTIVNICIVQTRIGIAIHGVAKELSHYSYLYALTGLNESEAHLSEAAQGTKDDINGVIGNVNDVFNEIQKLADGGEAVLADAKSGALDADGVNAVLTEFESSYTNIETAGGAIKETLTDFASDPKKVAFGLAKIAASDGLDLAKSRLIAAPLAKALCQKNLRTEKGGDVDAYLKGLGVLPGASGSYLDGLDFSKSSLFADGSNEIRINVSYDVKVITLLPIDFSFHFNQTAVTHGWLAGENSYRTAQEVLDTTTNSNIWNEGTTSERSELIRHQGIQEMKGEGYEQTRGLTDVPLYNSEKNEFMAIYSMNPLYSPEGEETKTLDDINKDVIKEQIEYICGSITSTTDGRTTVGTKVTLSDGSTKKNEYDCTGASNKIILVIPEDEGLKEYIQAVINEAECRGVTIELQTGYGNGARTTVVEDNEEDGGSEGE